MIRGAGPDAPVYVDGRRVSDEERVDLGRQMTEGEFPAELAARFPAPVEA